MAERRGRDVGEIAKYKIMDASKVINDHLIAEDSGFYIESLKGFPGPFVKPFLETIGLSEILTLIKNKKNRKATLRSAVCYYNPVSRKTKIFMHDLNGILALKPRGFNTRGWSEMTKLFIPDGFTKTLAEMSDDEWNRLTVAENNFDELGKFLEKQH